MGVINTRNLWGDRYKRNPGDLQTGPQTGPKTRWEAIADIRTSLTQD